MLVERKKSHALERLEDSGTMAFWASSAGFLRRSLGNEELFPSGRFGSILQLLPPANLVDSMA